MKNSTQITNKIKADYPIFFIAKIVLVAVLIYCAAVNTKAQVRKLNGKDVYFNRSYKTYNLADSCWYQLSFKHDTLMGEYKIYYFDGKIKEEGFFDNRQILLIDSMPTNMDYEMLAPPRPFIVFSANFKDTASLFKYYVNNSLYKGDVKRYYRNGKLLSAETYLQQYINKKYSNHCYSNLVSSEEFYPNGKIKYKYKQTGCSETEMNFYPNGRIEQISYTYLVDTALLRKDKYFSLNWKKKVIYTYYLNGLRKSIESWMLNYDSDNCFKILNSFETGEWKKWNIKGTNIETVIHNKEILYKE